MVNCQLHFSIYPSLAVGCHPSTGGVKYLEVNIIVSGQHVVDFPESEKYATDKAQKLEKFHSKIEKIELHLISKSAHRDKDSDFYCEIIIDIPGKNLEIKEHAQSMDKAIDTAVERMKMLLVKDKEKQLNKERRTTIRGNK